MAKEKDPVLTEELMTKIRELRAQTGMNRRAFAQHLGIPLRTVEDWEAGRRTPPEYVPRLIEYQLKYEKLMQELKSESADEAQQ